jgi:lipoate-protein ligase A
VAAGSGADSGVSGRGQRFWRLIVEDVAEEGGWNMALDRAVQLERAAGESPATLRLYRWKRPTVSLGRFQDAEDVDAGVCRSEGIDVVRRFTGGRGVLHDDELTYSVVAATEDGIPAGTMASYRYLCGALVAAYRLMGIDATVTSRPRGERSSAACYLHATQADVSVGARKLAGSAQVWHHDVVLQHGSFIIGRDIDREARVFSLDRAQARALAEHTLTIGDRGPASDPRRLASTVARAFQQLVGEPLVPGQVTAREISLAHELRPELEVPLTQRSQSGLSG